jgi:hypothetical protein
MLNRLKNLHYKFAGAMTAGALLTSVPKAHAANNFSSIAENITNSIQDLPGLLSGVSYMFGILLGVLGVLKIKDHVENPTQTPLAHGAIRLAAGGALFALPILFESMSETLGQGQTVAPATLKGVTFTTS